MNLINKNIISWKRRQKKPFGCRNTVATRKRAIVFTDSWWDGCKVECSVDWEESSSLTDKVSCPLMDPEQSWPRFLSSHETGLPKALFHLQLFHLKKQVYAMQPYWSSWLSKQVAPIAYHSHWQVLIRLLNNQQTNLLLGSRSHSKDTCQKQRFSFLSGW